jgi:hypothetical protein
MTEDTSVEALIERIKGSRLHIATPCYGGMVAINYSLALMRTIQMFADLKVPVQLHFTTNESLITRARNNLLAEFMATDGTHFMFIDADIEWEPEAVLRLLAAEKPLIGGAYPMKMLNWRAMESAVRGGKGDIRRFSAVYALNFDAAAPYLPDDDVVRVQDLATGFMMIRRDVIESLQAAHRDLKYDNHDPRLSRVSFALFDTMIDPDTRLYLSEDYAFCRRWQKIGGEVWLDRRIVLNHVGTYKFEGDAQAIWQFQR